MRDRNKLRVFGDPGSAAHHFALMSFVKASDASIQLHAVLLECVA
jgi:hypothetical protein